jgi:hypothetical protein
MGTEKAVSAAQATPASVRIFTVKSFVFRLLAKTPKRL